MADNYLERRMEEYRRSRQGAAAGHAKRSTPSLKPGQIAVDYPAIRVFVTDAMSPAGEAVIEAFRRFNCRVAFSCDDRTYGNRLAQKTGAQFHPDGTKSALQRLADAGDPATVIINLGSDIPGGNIPTLIPPANVIAAGPAHTAAWCLYAAHPLNLPLCKTSISI